MQNKLKKKKLNCSLINCSSMEQLLLFKAYHHRASINKKLHKKLATIRQTNCQQLPTKRSRLAKFYSAIDLLAHAEYVEVVEELKLLYEILKHETMDLSEREFNQTIYPYLIDHFTRLIYKIRITPVDKIIDVVKVYADDLDDKIKQKKAHKPISKKLKSSICAVIGALIGVSVCAAIVSVASIWSGGFTALPMVILGGKMMASVSCVIGGIGGFFSAKNNIRKYKADIKHFKQGRETMVNIENKMFNKQKNQSTGRYEKVTFVVMSDRYTIGKIIYPGANKPIHPLLRHFKNNQDPYKLVELLTTIAKQSNYHDWVEFTECESEKSFKLFRAPIKPSKRVLPDELARRIKEDMADREEQRLTAQL